MLKRNSFSRIKFKDFWQPIIITYTITVILIVIACILQFNFSNNESAKIMFYNVDVGNYIILTLAKVSESLAPTTITFSLLLILTSEHNQIKKILPILLIICLGGTALIQPTVKNIVGFWVVLILLYVLIIISLLVVSSLVSSQDSEFRSNHKFEKSDGKFIR